MVNIIFIFILPFPTPHLLGFISLLSEKVYTCFPPPKSSYSFLSSNLLTLAHAIEPTGFSYLRPWVVCLLAPRSQTSYRCSRVPPALSQALDSPLAAPCYSRVSLRQVSYTSIPLPTRFQSLFRATWFPKMHKNGMTVSDVLVIPSGLSEAMYTMALPGGSYPQRCLS